MKEYLTVLEDASGEYTEKRSKFISGIYHIETEEDAQNILSRVKSENFGANHNVYAYVLSGGATRFSDDSEPHGTAGKPVLEVIEGNNLKDVIIVVTRYFGGVLLGTGGLVRAYTTAAKNAVENSTVVKMCECTILSVKCDYSDYERLCKVISNSDGKISNTLYEEKVLIEFSLLSADVQKFEDDLRETFSSRINAKCEKIGIFPIKYEF